VLNCVVYVKSRLGQYKFVGASLVLMPETLSEKRQSSRFLGDYCADFVQDNVYDALTYVLVAG
jgi:hypothetical protein